MLRLSLIFISMAMEVFNLWSVTLLGTVGVGFAFSKSKYSEEMNVQTTQYGTLEKPFRMQKINLIWEKAQRRLIEQKLKKLYLDLKVQDKEELSLKKLKADGQDKDGLKEAELRRKLTGIMKKYGLGSDTKLDPESQYDQLYNDQSIEYLNKRLFTDKKLNKLWWKAEKSGFTDEELKKLKEEFQHHQEKIEQYRTLVEKANQGAELQNDEMDNSVEAILEGEESEGVEKNASAAHQMIQEKHKEVKNGYERLVKYVVEGPEKTEFEENRVQQLWNLAQKADFTPSELSSLKEELEHFEHRVKKLKYFEAEMELPSGREGDKKPGQKNREQSVQQYADKVEKIQNELKNRIMQRHLEL